MQRCSAFNPKVPEGRNAIFSLLVVYCIFLVCLKEKIELTTELQKVAIEPVNGSISREKDIRAKVVNLIHVIIYARIDYDQYRILRFKNTPIVESTQTIVGQHKKHLSKGLKRKTAPVFVLFFLPFIA